MRKLPNAKEILFDRMVTQHDGFHDESGFKETMSCGYGEQIYGAMIEYAKRVLNYAVENIKLKVKQHKNENGELISEISIDIESVIKIKNQLE